jgi:hypothetical protein
LCAGPGSLAAPSTLQWFERLACPAGQTADYELVPAPGAVAGDLMRYTYCVDGAGQRTLAAGRFFGVMFGVYFGALLVPALLLGLTMQVGGGQRAQPRPLGWEAEAEVRGLIAQGQHAKAVKLVQAKTGRSARRAEEFVKVMASRPELPEAPPKQSPAPAASPLDRMKQLKALLDTGLISGKEFEAKKAEILEAM